MYANLPYYAAGLSDLPLQINDELSIAAFVIFETWS